MQGHQSENVCFGHDNPKIWQSGLWTQIPPRNIINQNDHVLYHNSAIFGICVFDFSGKP